MENYMKLIIKIENAAPLVIENVYMRDNPQCGKGKILGNRTNVKTTAAVDVEKLNSINELVESLVTENRLKQGLEYLTEQHLEHEPKNLGTFIKWVMGDVIKEEMDTIHESGTTVKDFTKSATGVIRNWFLSQL